MGPRRPPSTVLTKGQAATIVAFRRQALLPLDDCLYTLQASSPYLTRSAVHRCLQRHGISRLPDIKGEKRIKIKFAHYPIGGYERKITSAEAWIYFSMSILKIKRLNR